MIYFVKESVSVNKKERAKAAVELLKEKYPDAKCSLNAKTPFQLLVATRLSAQCTDQRVNMVTPALFEKFPDAKAFSAADVKEVEECIKSCGLYKTKAKDICNMAKIIENDFNGELPATLQELIKLPGVGRKTANLICGDVYGMPAVVADTHCIRISERLGLTEGKDPKKVEFSLKKILPQEESSDFCHRIVLFGRDTCTARNPKCHNCCLYDICKTKNLKPKGK